MDECETAPALVEGKFAGMEFYSQKEMKIKYTFFCSYFLGHSVLRIRTRWFIIVHFDADLAQTFYFDAHPANVPVS